MDSRPTRSQQVVDAYKKRKLAISALARIRQMTGEFKRGGRLDSYIAFIGLIGLLVSMVLIAVLSYYFFGRSEVVILQ